MLGDARGMSHVQGSECGGVRLRMGCDKTKGPMISAVAVQIDGCHQQPLPVASASECWCTDTHTHMRGPTTIMWIPATMHRKTHNKLITSSKHPPPPSLLPPPPQVSSLKARHAAALDEVGVRVAGVVGRKDEALAALRAELGAVSARLAALQAL